MLAGAADLLEDRLALRALLVALRPEIPLGQVGPGGGDQLTHAGKAPWQDDVLAQIPKEPLDQVEPGGAGGGVKCG